MPYTDACFVLLSKSVEQFFKIKVDLFNVCFEQDVDSSKQDFKL